MAINSLHEDLRKLVGLRIHNTIGRLRTQNYPILEGRMDQTRLRAAQSHVGLHLQTAEPIDWNSTMKVCAMISHRIAYTL